MPEAPALENNVPEKGTVNRDEYAYYKVRVEGKQSVVKVKLVALHGDPDVSAGVLCIARVRWNMLLIRLPSALCRKWPLSAPGQIQQHLEKERARG